MYTSFTKLKGYLKFKDILNKLSLGWTLFLQAIRALVVSYIFGWLYARIIGFLLSNIFYDTVSEIMITASSVFLLNVFAAAVSDIVSVENKKNKYKSFTGKTFWSFCSWGLRNMFEAVQNEVC